MVILTVDDIGGVSLRGGKICCHSFHLLKAICFVVTQIKMANLLKTGEFFFGSGMEHSVSTLNQCILVQKEALEKAIPVILEISFPVLFFSKIRVESQMSFSNNSVFLVLVLSEIWCQYFLLLQWYENFSFLQCFLILLRRISYCMNIGINPLK